eukprot:TRINITY_DN38060_c0_g1_i1.p1 TRINITY_DN38060_c0_g1~~TRINITY_DN38060_c0_g1_i1.p1  ORF type:complete len:330 (-),score=90.87 TRINITY_DN38060_c0_g1_i1:145-1134(-)
MSGTGEGRFYEKEFPELDEIVVVQVRRIVDMGAYVQLLEYDNKEGMMLLSELSKRRIRSVAKLLRVGRTEICLCLRVDQDKGYIDLSKRRVEPEDANAKEEQFARAKAVHGIMRHVAQSHDVPVNELSNKVSWPLDKKFTDAFEAFKKHASGEIDMWEGLDFSQPGQDISHLADKLKEDIEINLKRRLVQQTIRLRAKVEVSCAEYDGIEAVKEALTKGLEASKEDCEIKINLVAHPVFVLTCTCKDKAVGIAGLEHSMELIEKCAKEKKGDFMIKSKPELIGADEKEEDESEEEGSEEESDQEGMGELDEEQMRELMKKKVDDDGDDE